MIFLVWEIIITLGVVFVDLLSKRLAETLLMPLPGYTFPLIENVIHFTYTRNTGAAFSMLEGQRTFFIIIASIAVVVMVAYLLYSKNESKLLRIGVSLMLGGTVGNTVDRVAYGYVRDMIDFRLINFAIFNIADSALCIGVALLIIWIIFYYKPDDGKKKSQQESISESDQIQTDVTNCEQTNESEPDLANTEKENTNGN